MSISKADGLQTSLSLQQSVGLSDGIFKAEVQAQQLRSEALATIMKSIVKSVKNRAASSRGHRELLDLDDRLLRDIGLTRSEIRTAMNTGAIDLTGLMAPVVGLAKGVVNAYRGWRHRHHVYQQLSALDDRMLQDIGMRRDDVEAIAFRGKIRKPILHAPVNVKSLTTHAVAGIDPHKDTKHLAA